MNDEERALAQAAASLTVDDFRYLQEHGMIAVPAQVSDPDTQVTVAREEEEPPEPRPKRKRRTIKREWPEVGTVLQADYEGVHYEAEVIAAPARPAASRIVRQCPVCDHVLLGRGSYCPECGSEV